MRISDNRYNRDRTRFDLAVRMMGHQARTCTIKAWTGFSEDRIRKLYKAYLLHMPGAARVRHRGKSPRQPVYFLQTAEVSFEAATLASLLQAAGLLPLKDRGAPADAHSLSLKQAETFCETYEAYVRLCPARRISFEYAWFLYACLMDRREIKLIRCKQCGRLYLTDSERLPAPTCGCGGRQCGWPRRGRLPKTLIQAYDGWCQVPPPGQRPGAPALQSSPLAPFE